MPDVIIPTSDDVTGTTPAGALVPLVTGAAEIKSQSWSAMLAEVLAAVRAGTNVTIDRATAGQITVAAAGGGGGGTAAAGTPWTAAVDDGTFPAQTSAAKVSNLLVAASGAAAAGPVTALNSRRDSMTVRPGDYLVVFECSVASTGQRFTPELWVTGGTASAYSTSEYLRSAGGGHVTLIAYFRLAASALVGVSVTQDNWASSPSPRAGGTAVAFTAGRLTIQPVGGVAGPAGAAGAAGEKGDKGDKGDPGPAGSTFTPTQSNLYGAVKEILLAGDNVTVTADDDDHELTVASTAAGGGGRAWTFVRPPAADRTQYGGTTYADVWQANALARMRAAVAALPTPSAGDEATALHAASPPNADIYAYTWTGSYWVEDASFLNSLNFTATGAVRDAVDAPVTGTVTQWSASQTYSPGAVVVHESLLYVCAAGVGPTDTQPPQDASHWQAARPRLDTSGAVPDGANPMASLRIDGADYEVTDLAARASAGHRESAELRPVGTQTDNRTAYSDAGVVNAVWAQRSQLAAALLAVSGARAGDQRHALVAVDDDTVGWVRAVLVANVGWVTQTWQLPLGDLVAAGGAGQPSVPLGTLDTPHGLPPSVLRVADIASGGRLVAPVTGLISGELTPEVERLDARIDHIAGHVGQTIQPFSNTREYPASSFCSLRIVSQGVGTTVIWVALVDVPAGRGNPIANPTQWAQLGERRFTGADLRIILTEDASAATVPGGDEWLGLATPSYDGLMSAAEHGKLDGIEPGAEVNVQANWAENDPDSDAYIMNRPDPPGDLMIWRGEWSRTESYTPSEVVRHDGAVWIAAADSTGVEPAATATQWSLVHDAPEARGGLPTWVSSPTTPIPATKVGTGGIPSDVTSVLVAGSASGQWRDIQALIDAANIPAPTIPVATPSADGLMPAADKAWADRVSPDASHWWRGRWTLAAEYRKGEVVQDRGSWYYATSAHTATATNAPHQADSPWFSLLVPEVSVGGAGEILVGTSGHLTQSLHTAESTGWCLHRGNWQNNHDYQRNNVVRHNSATWYALLRSGPGHGGAETPTPTSSHWALW